MLPSCLLDLGRGFLGLRNTVRSTHDNCTQPLAISMLVDGKLASSADKELLGNLQALETLRQSRKKAELDTSAEAYYASVTGSKRRAWAAPDSLVTSEATENRNTVVANSEPWALERDEQASAEAPSRSGDGHSEEGEDSEEPRQQGIGYKLLRKAGWRGSGGLGAQEQGIASPLIAWQQQGRLGIGSSHDNHRPEAVPEARFKPDAGKREHVAKVSEKDSQNEPTNARRGKLKRAPKREWESVRVEESVDTKVQRWRQVLQAEADDKAGKAIDRYMMRAFREDEADTNPLMRRNNLSVSNPLL